MSRQRHQEGDSNAGVEADALPGYVSDIEQSRTA